MLLLPAEVDGGIELFGVLDHPDLLAHREIGWIQRQRRPPTGERLLRAVLLILGRAQCKSGRPIGHIEIGSSTQCGLSIGEAPIPQERVAQGKVQSRVVWITDKFHPQHFDVRRFLAEQARRLRRVREVCRQERVHLRSNFGSADVEATDMDEAQNPLFIDEQPVRNHVEVKHAPKQARTVDDRRKRLITRVRPRSVGIDVDGDAQEGEIAPLRTFLQKLLPHGQLFTALSPAGPHKYEQSLATVVV